MIKHIFALFFCIALNAPTHSQEISEQIDFNQNNLVNMSLKEYWHGHFAYLSSAMETTHVREPETRCRYWTRFCGGLVFAGAVANGMIPVFLQYVAKNTPDVNYNLTLAMIATGVVYGTDCLMNFLEKKEDETDLKWKATAAISSILPAYYLFSVENDHHKAAKNTGWDEYYTFCATLALPLVLDKYLSLLNLGNDYYREFNKNSRYGLIGKRIDALTTPEINMVWKHIVEKNETAIDLPASVLNEQFEELWFTAFFCPVLIFSVPSIPAFYMLWQETYDSVNSSLYVEIAKSILTAVSFGSATSLNLYHARNFECLDILCIPFGIAKSIPFMVLTDAALKDWYPSDRQALIVFASIFPVLEEAAKSRKTIKNILKRIPYFKNTDWCKRNYLKENLI